MNNKLYIEQPILIVDDDQGILDSLKSAFRPEGINNVDVCNDERKVMGMLKLKNYTLILLDISMNYIEGDTLLKQIHQEYRDIKVIMITAHDEVKRAVECMKLGAFDYYVKSFDIMELVELVKKTLNTSCQMKQIFISYSHQDKEFVVGLEKNLLSAGFKVWIDEKSIKVGSVIPEKILEGISHCDFFCVILSKNSIKSSWVERECRMAIKAQKQPLPIIIHEVELPTIFRDLRYADFSWDPDKGFSQLLDTIKA
jgi:CheY-like chemotaxis protein